MTYWERMRQRREDVRSRAEQPDQMYSYCRIPHCNQPARAGTGDGLDQRYCRHHADHYQRHGNPVKKTYPAKLINPYRQAALLWVMEHDDNFLVVDSIRKIKGLYRRSGQMVEAFRLRGLPPEARAKALWARLREAGVDPSLPVAAWLAVELIIRDDPQPDLRREFKRVQAAKIVHRMASGTHRQWQHERPHPLHPGLPPITEIEEKHWYPKSRGRVLRHIGEDLEGAVELLVDHHLDEIREFKQERDSTGAYTSSPYPKGISAKSLR